MNLLYLIASTTEGTAEKAGLFESLGINWMSLVLQSIAFLALLWLLSKYVFPILLSMLDERDKRIEAGQKAAAEAVKAAEKAEASTEKNLEQARKDAAEIVETARKEAAVIAEEAETRATKKADHLISQAQARIESDIAEAKKSLHEEMISLVAVATEKVAGQKIDARTDTAMIKKALQESK